ncbi:hypothetical protein [Pseudomonas protegens]|uniref:YdcA family protein n=1 Tax=Pseudomonas protegens TaxID=380021 RepID=UPI000F497522|nr:hypothetical protein [Pseudomonas protegens]ROL84763.1 hypothetical protein BK639_30005 [Pseudomonas protegens]ROM00512.1 hypothetical protein BK641_20810 [Pseudomonas protegens]ROM09833.1 hypothetical protein BK642_11455 [Pseudomonas protegens]ROM10974.1 hypothetical protein BK640_04040 [Pseudomonas protegens]
MSALTRVGWKPFVAVCLLLLCSAAAQAANQPCSGKKGGIARCDGELFLCNDGSISASKKNCALMFGQRSSTPRAEPLLRDTQGCTCGSGSFCTGPRGGVYCLTPSGNKSYKRR